MASLFTKLKAKLFGAESERAEDIEPTFPEEETSDQGETNTQAETVAVTEEESALLRRLSAMRIVKTEDLSRSFLEMRVYTFAEPFERPDLLNLVRAMRFLGFRFYSLGIEIGERETSCESLAALARAIGEAESPIKGCTVAGSYSAARVNCHIDPDGKLQITHDSSRPISFEPFEELFAQPEESDSELS